MYITGNEGPENEPNDSQPCRFGVGCRVQVVPVCNNLPACAPKGELPIRKLLLRGREKVFSMFVSVVRSFVRSFVSSFVRSFYTTVIGTHFNTIVIREFKNLGPRFDLITPKK